jgi:hypothetical protein
MAQSSGSYTAFADVPDIAAGPADPRQSTFSATGHKLLLGARLHEHLVDPLSPLVALG